MQSKSLHPTDHPRHTLTTEIAVQIIFNFSPVALETGGVGNSKRKQTAYDKRNIKQSSSFDAWTETAYSSDNDMRDPV